MGPLIGRLLGGLGLLAAATYLAMLVFVPVSWDTVVAGLAALGLAAWVYLDWDMLARVARTPGGRDQTISWLLIAVVGGCCFLTMRLVQDSPKTWDLSEGELHSLDPQTIAIIEGLPPELEVSLLGFFAEGFDPGEDARRQRFARFGDAARALNPNLNVEIINPDFDPISTAKHGVSRSGTIVVWARPRGLPDDSAPAQDRSRSEQVEGTDEQSIANALLRVQDPRPRVGYFVTGHGEASHTEPGERGLTALGAVLERIGYKVESWSTPSAKAVPSDATLVVLAGPTSSLSEGETALFDDYIRTGGAMLIAVDPELDAGLDPHKGMESMLLGFGLGLGADLVLDPIQSDRGIAVLPLGLPEGFHAVISAMDPEIPLAFKMAQSVLRAEAPPSGVRTHSLVTSSSEAWGEKDLESEEISLDSEVDTPGPLSFAAVAQLETSEQIQDNPLSLEPTRSGRLVLVGDVDWMTDSRIAAVANGDFITRVIAFLGSQDDRIELPPRDRSATQLDLTGLRLPLLILLAVLVVPGASLITGLVLWGMRRAS